MNEIQSGKASHEISVKKDWSYCFCHEAEIRMAYSGVSTGLMSVIFNNANESNLHLDEDLPRAWGWSIQLHQASGDLARVVIDQAFVGFGDFHGEKCRLRRG